MTIGTLEILALILIVFAVIKIIALLIKPQLWFDFIEKLYAKPQITSNLALILAIFVLYLLIVSGVTIVEILAVCLFVALLIATGFSKYSSQVIAWAKQQEVVSVVKNLWLYTFVWLLLLAWGVGEILLG